MKRSVLERRRRWPPLSSLTRMIRHAGPMKLQMKWFSVLSQHLFPQTQRQSGWFERQSWSAVQLLLCTAAVEVRASAFHWPGGCTSGAARLPKCHREQSHCGATSYPPAKEHFSATFLCVRLMNGALTKPQIASLCSLWINNGPLFVYSPPNYPRHADLSSFPLRHRQPSNFLPVPAGKFNICPLEFIINTVCLSLLPE